MDGAQTIKYLQGQQAYHEKQISKMQLTIESFQAAIARPLSAKSVRNAQEQIELWQGRIESENGHLESVKASLAATIAGPEITEPMPEKKSKRGK